MLLWIIIIAASVILDQVTKTIVMNTMELYQSIPVIENVFSFTYIHNYGAAWGMFSENRWIFLVISFVAIIALPVFLYKYRKAPFLFGFSLSLIIGGAIGNMIDRLFAPNGGVTDFIEFGFMEFPIFNVADIFVCIGAVLLFVYLAFLDKVVFPADEKKKTTCPEKEKND